jgi:hypothetical protein
MAEVSGQAVRVIHDGSGNSAGADETPERPQLGTVHRCPRDTFIDQHMCLRDQVAFAFCQLLAGFDLCGNGKAFPLVFCGHADINGSISQRMVALARVPLCMVHASLLPVVITSVLFRFATVS